MNFKNFLHPVKYALSCCFACCILLGGCDPDRIFEENAEIKDGIWSVYDTLKFKVDITDTVTPNDFYINIRHTGMYPFSNLCMFFNSVFPDRSIRRDSIECILADNAGKWSGSGLGDIWDVRIPFIRGVKFPQKGNYCFFIEQAQRHKDKAYIENLPFIMDVGLRIERQSH